MRRLCELGDMLPVLTMGLVYMPMFFFVNVKINVVYN